MVHSVDRCRTRVLPPIVLPDKAECRRAIRLRASDGAPDHISRTSCTAVSLPREAVGVYHGDRWPLGARYMSAHSIQRFHNALRSRAVSYRGNRTTALSGWYVSGFGVRGIVIGRGCVFPARLLAAEATNECVSPGLAGTARRFLGRSAGLRRGSSNRNRVGTRRQ